jgi:hypothetical protein
VLAAIENVAGKPSDWDMSLASQHYHQANNNDKQTESDDHLANFGHTVILKHRRRNRASARSSLGSVFRVPGLCWRGHFNAGKQVADAKSRTELAKFRHPRRLERGSIQGRNGLSSLVKDVLGSPKIRLERGEAH